MRLPLEQLPAIGGFGKTAATLGVAQALGQMAYPAPAPASAPPLDQGEIDSLVFGQPRPPARLPEIGASEFGDLLKDPLADYVSVYEGLDPITAAFAEKAARKAPARRNGEQVVQGAVRGLSLDQQDANRRQQAVAKTTSEMLANSAHLDDSQFGELIAQYRAKLGQAPQLPAQARPTAPNQTQLLVAALAAALNPSGAAQAVAAPFQAGLQDADLRNQQALQNYQIQSQQYGQDVDALQGLLRLQSGRDVAQGQLDVQMRGQDEITKRNALGDVADAKTPAGLQQAFTSLDAAGLGDLIPEEVREARLAEAQRAADDAADEKRKRETLERANKAYTVANSTSLNVDAATKAQNARLARQLVASVDPTDPVLDELDGLIRTLEKPSQAQLNAGRKADDQHNLDVKRGKQLDAQTLSIARRYKIDGLRLQTYMPEFREKIARSQAARRNVESQVAARNLHGSLASAKAQRKLDGEEGALTKSDVKLLTSESQALAKEASVLRAQRNALSDRFTGEVRKGSEATAKDLDARISSISQRQSEIGKTFRISREADQRIRAAAAAPKPPTLQGKVGGGGGGQLPAGWSFGGDK